MDLQFRKVGQVRLGAGERSVWIAVWTPSTRLCRCHRIDSAEAEKAADYRLGGIRCEEGSSEANEVATAAAESSKLCAPRSSFTKIAVIVALGFRQAFRASNAHMTALGCFIRIKCTVGATVGRAHSGRCDRVRRFFQVFQKDTCPKHHRLFPFGGRAQEACW